MHTRKFPLKLYVAAFKAFKASGSSTFTRRAETVRRKFRISRPQLAGIMANFSRSYGLKASPPEGWTAWRKATKPSKNAGTGCEPVPNNYWRQRFDCCY